ncbi:MAG: glutamyl-tRNA amidotransferase [Anaerolineaceae bacterium]|nr:glutamyl-tRNA amidotransferase [Anaerolineaceae bacterium]
MEDPRPKMQEALKEAMKNRDAQRRNVIRLTQSAIKQVEIDTRKELSTEDVVAILQKEAKSRRESIDEMTAAGRTETAAEAEAELRILEEFLPQQLSRAEVEALVQQAIAETGASSPADMGKVMGKLMPQVKGRADGGMVSQVVRESLSQ